MRIVNRPDTARREFGESDIKKNGSSRGDGTTDRNLSTTFANDMNRVSEMLAGENDAEIDEILEKVRLVLDFDARTAPNLVNAFAQADRRGMTITVAASRFESLDAMYYRVRNLIHEVRHLTLANDVLPGSGDWAKSPTERDAVSYAQEIMDKYWSSYVK